MIFRPKASSQEDKSLNTRSSARPVAYSVGGRSKQLEVQAMSVQHMSKQIVLKVHKTSREEHEADVWTKHVLQADTS